MEAKEFLACQGLFAELATHSPEHWNKHADRSILKESYSGHGEPLLRAADPIRPSGKNGIYQLPICLRRLQARKLEPDEGLVYSQM
jgi:hypothetical protein